MQPFRAERLLPLRRQVHGHLAAVLRAGSCLRFRPEGAPRDPGCRLPSLRRAPAPAEPLAAADASLVRVPGRWRG